MIWRMTPTTTLFNRTDPRQPTDAEIFAVAETLIENFGGDLGRARGWAIDEAIRYNAEGDRTRNLIAVRLSRAVKQITRQKLKR